MYFVCINYMYKIFNIGKFTLEDFSIFKINYYWPWIKTPVLKDEALLRKTLEAPLKAQTLHYLERADPDACCIANTGVPKDPRAGV